MLERAGFSMATRRTPSCAHSRVRPERSIRTLRAHEAALAPRPKERPPSNDSIGNNFAGRYTLIETIGDGGMGSVHLATQSQPVKRQVALKLIKSGMDFKAVLARFVAERQTLALMDHPNIARICDGGVTPTGQPFFVMEMVEGVPLTEYCDKQRLTVAARLTWRSRTPNVLRIVRRSSESTK